MGAVPDSGLTGAGKAPDDEDSRPATVGDLRRLRLWLIVAGVWAAAATAIAVIALLDDGDEEERATAAEVSARVSRVERDLKRELQGIRTDMEALPGAGDLSRVDRRLKEVEDDASRAARDAKSADEKAGELEERIGELEDAGGGETTTPTTTTP